jgi:hypothetical protein
MLGTITLLAVTALSAAPIQDAQEILATVASKQAERMASVENYTIIQRVQGAMEAPFYYEAFNPLGGPTRLFRLVPMVEWQERGAPPGFDAAAMASGLKLGMNTLAGGLSTQMIGTPAGQILRPAAMEGMLEGANAFLDAAATPPPNTGAADAMDASVNAVMFAERARFIGRETVNGQEAFLLRADDLSDLPAQEMGEATFVLERASVWIDAEMYVQLRLRMEGRMEADKRSVPIVIELNELDYASVGPLYEPLSKVMRITGLMSGMEMDPKQAKKMAKARADMEKLKLQIAQMPASQRAMVQGQVDKAEAMMAQMLGNDVMETEVELMVYSINKGPPFKWLPFCPSLEPDAPAFPTPVAGATPPPPGACGS